MNTNTNLHRRGTLFVPYPQFSKRPYGLITAFFIIFLNLQSSVNGQSAPSIQPIDADTLLFNDEYEFRDFLKYHNLKNYTIKPQVDFYDCNVNPGTQIYTGQHDDDFLHEERFIGKPLVFIVDHNGTRKIYNILIPSLGDTTITTCDVDLLTMNPATGQVAWFKDIYNWIDENGRNIFSLNKKIYFLWGYSSENHDFPTDMIQTTTGIDFTFPDYFPEDSAAISLIFTDITMYTQAPYYPDIDLDGFGDSTTTELLAYPFDPPAGYVTNRNDCDDLNNTRYAGASEIENAIDDDCNGLIDDYLQNFYADADGDGFGNIAFLIQDIVAPAGYVSDSTDCDDTQPLRNPAAAEICNSIDDNCNDVIDDDPLPMTASITPVGSVNVCRPQKVTLNAQPTGSGFTYTWKRNGIVVAVPDNTNPTAQFGNSGSYKVEVTMNASCVDESDPILVNVYQKPVSSISNITGTNNLCVEDSIVLKSSNTAIGNSYQWKFNLSNIAGATLDTYTTLTPGDYKVTVTNANGCSKISATYAIVMSCKEAELNTTKGLTIYPNPVAEDIFISFAAATASNASLNIGDIAGKTIYSATLEMNEGMNEIQLPVNEWSKGLYIVHLQNGDEVSTGKFVKE
ncbi:MAG: MopE-related protein [Chitinophagales bacterium]